jgi:hypothetical protein|tara:strand:- start:155 stop:514 length:360 start_codon:yes stop_codon:yes gene_type:complete
MTNSILKKSALEKLEKLGLSQEEVLSLIDDGEETIVAEDGESDDTSESKSWQQLVMEEHLGYYNKRYNTDYNFEDYYDGVVNGEIEVHYNWKQMLGLEEQTPFPVDPNVNTEKFKKHGN